MKLTVTQALRPVVWAALSLMALWPTLASAQEHPIVLKVGLAYDGRGGSIRNTTIVVQDSKIVRIGGAAPRDAATYDLTGLTVTPGWIDTHSHIGYHFDNNGRNAGRGEPPVAGPVARGG